MLDAIDRRDWDGLAEELGDLVLQAVFFAQMAAKRGFSASTIRSTPSARS